MRVFVIVFAVTATLFNADALFLNQHEFNKDLNYVTKHVADTFLLDSEKPGKKPEQNQPGKKPEQNQPGQKKEQNQPGQNQHGKKPEQNQPGQNQPGKKPEQTQPGQNQPGQNEPIQKIQRVSQNLLMPGWMSLEGIQGRHNNQQSRSIEDMWALSDEDLSEFWEYWHDVYQNSKANSVINGIRDIFMPKQDQRLRRSLKESESIQTCIIQGIQDIVKCFSKSAGLGDESESLESEETTNRSYECDSFEGVSDDLDLAKCIVGAIIEFVTCATKV